MSLLIINDIKNFLAGKDIFIANFHIQMDKLATIVVISTLMRLLIALNWSHCGLNNSNIYGICILLLSDFKRDWSSATEPLQLGQPPEHSCSPFYKIAKVILMMYLNWKKKSHSRHTVIQIPACVKWWGTRLDCYGAWVVCCVVLSSIHLVLFCFTSFWFHLKMCSL